MYTFYISIYSEWESMYSGYELCKPECSMNGGAHTIFRGQERLEFSFMVMQSSMFNIEIIDN